MQQRQEGQSKEVRAIAWKAQQRLHKRYKVLTGRHKKTVIVVTALARELCGFVWAIACQLSAPEKPKQRESAPLPETKATVQNTPAQPKPSHPVAKVKRDYQLGATKKFKK